jgi:hypothetical protein
LRGVELSDANLYKTLGRMLESGQLGRKGAVYDLWLDEPGEALNAGQVVIDTREQREQARPPQDCYLCARIHSARVRATAVVPLVAKRNCW